MLYERSWSMKMEIQPPGRRNRRNRRNVYTRKGISQHSELRSCAARKLDRQKKVISQHSERQSQPRGLPCATAAGLTANATAKVAAQLAGRPQADTASDAAAAAQRRGVGPGAYGPAWGKEGSGV